MLEEALKNNARGRGAELLTAFQPSRCTAQLAADALHAA